MKTRTNNNNTTQSSSRNTDTDFLEDRTNNNNTTQIERKEQKILNTALCEIANNRLKILQISFEKIKIEINKHNEDDYLLDVLIKTRPVTDNYFTYFKKVSYEYTKFTSDNMTVVTDKNSHIQDISDTDSTNNGTVIQDTNIGDTDTDTHTSSAIRQTEKRHTPNKNKTTTTAAIQTPILPSHSSTTITVLSCYLDSIL